MLGVPMPLRYSLLAKCLLGEKKLNVTKKQCSKNSENLCRGNDPSEGLCSPSDTGWQSSCFECFECHVYGTTKNSTYLVAFENFANYGTLGSFLS